jgi:hypothetical protein
MLLKLPGLTETRFVSSKSFRIVLQGISPPAPPTPPSRTASPGTAKSRNFQTCSIFIGKPPNPFHVSSSNQKPETRNQKPETRNQKPETRNQKPET